MINSVKVQSVLQLMLAAVFWGFGFVAVVWCLKGLTVYEITFSRFAIGGLFGIVVVLLSGGRLDWKGTVKLSFWAGIFLTGTLVFQTLGLQYTTATKSGFITTLYVVLVPLLEAFYRRRRISLELWALVLLALFGTALIMKMEFHDLNKGDLLTLVCTAFAALHIFYIGLASLKVKHPFLFNTLQSLWACILVSPLLSHGDLWRKVAHIGEWDNRVLLGLLSLSLGSTTLAFYLQVRAQAHLSATVSSILFLLESPFALIFAFLLLNESLTFMEASGAALIFISALLVTIRESQR